MNEENSTPMVSYAVFEGEQVRHERREKRQMIFHLVIEILLVIALAAVIGLNTYERLQYDYTGERSDYSYEQDGDGNNNLNTGTQGDVDYGAEASD